MDSSPAYGNDRRRLPKMIGIETQSSPAIQFRRRPSHRSKCRSMSSLSTLLSSNNTNYITTTPSSSSLSCFDNCNQDFNPSHNKSPISSSPARPFPSRIPFSWEKHPGIPKQQKQDSKKKLPLPPAAITNNNSDQNYSSKRYTSRSSEEMGGSFREDPFVIAMVECSKDKHPTRRRRGGGRRSISSIIMNHLSCRIGMMINMNTSCKCSSTVSESSIVHLPSTTTLRGLSSSLTPSKLYHYEAERKF